MVQETSCLNNITQEIRTKLIESLERLRPELREDQFLIGILLDSATLEYSR